MFRVYERRKAYIVSPLGLDGIKVRRDRRESQVLAGSAGIERVLLL